LSLPHVKDWWDTYYEQHAKDESRIFGAGPTWAAFFDALKEQYYPVGRKIHNVFHVSCLKKSLRQHVVANEELPIVDEEGHLILIPEDILEVRDKLLRNKDIKEYLVKRKSFPREDATWESEHVLQQTSSRLLVGKQFLVGETVMFPSP
jgi:hypothetical protein